MGHVPRGGGADGPQGDLLLEPRMLGLVEGAQAVLVDLTQDAKSAVLDCAVLGSGHAPSQNPQNTCAATAVIETVSLGYVAYAGVGERNRTSKTFRAPDPKSGASAVPPRRHQARVMVSKFSIVTGSMASAGSKPKMRE